MAILCSSPLVYRSPPLYGLSCLPHNLRRQNQVKLAQGTKASVNSLIHQPSSVKAKSSNWWLPLLDWLNFEFKLFSGDGQQLNHFKKVKDVYYEDNPSSQAAAAAAVTADSDERAAKDLKRSVRFTPEMAKQLREELRRNSTFHDLMYHSSIASRLASSDTE